RIDTRKRPTEKPWEELLEATDLDWLKNRKFSDGSAYQFEAVKSAVRSARGIIRSSVGSGKGWYAVGIAKTVPVKWLFLVHRQHLLEDIMKRWDERGDGSAPKRIGSEYGCELAER